MRSMQRTGESFLAELAKAARSRVAAGYYKVPSESEARKLSLAKSLRRKDRIPIIAEVKFRSPAEGRLARRRDVGEVAAAYESGGASGISVLTEPEHFDGRLGYVSMVKRSVRIPVLMKDVVVDEAQVEAARRLGADAVLLITGIFERGEADGTLAEMIARVHSGGMEVVVEAHDERELDVALSNEADVVGINNRNLADLSVSTAVSRRLLRRAPFAKPVICESGIGTRGEVVSLKRLGADGFLIGSALMKSKSPASALRELTRLGP
ncbi:MAG: indole-3-glycerol-phosphate synthase [Nitrososphaerota archaeon]|nr:indole-3-glycerol-phosphate synthase [Nitrososphaerota archaeon]